MHLPTTRHLVIGASLLDGVLAGASLDRSIVQLPAFRHLGPQPWAAFSREADLRNGAYWYPPLAIAGTVLGIAAAARSLRDRSASRSTVWSLGLAAALAATGLLATLGAAPNMLRLRRIGNDADELRRAQDGFERWQARRAALQALAFGANVWSLATLA